MNQLGGSIFRRTGEQYLAATAPKICVRLVHRTGPKKGRKKEKLEYRNKRQNLCLLANSLKEEKGGGR